MSRLVLYGIVGSTAYGLAGPSSDVDRLGIFLDATESRLGLHSRRSKDTITTTHPDSSLYEAEKWCSLALGCNPTVMELLWLPEDLYDTRTPAGDELLEMRGAFLSAKRVSTAYLGYAWSQFTKLSARGDGTFSSDLRNRTAKHARHMARLLYQVMGLHTTGRLEVRLTPEQADHCRAIGDQAADADLREVQRLLNGARDLIESVSSALPEHPDEDRVDAWPRRTRLAALTEAASRA